MEENTGKDKQNDSRWGAAEDLSSQEQPADSSAEESENIESAVEGALKCNLCGTVFSNPSEKYRHQCSKLIIDTVAGTDSDSWISVAQVLKLLGLILAFLIGRYSYEITNQFIPMFDNVQSYLQVQLSILVIADILALMLLWKLIAGIEFKHKLTIMFVAFLLLPYFSYRDPDSFNPQDRVKILFLREFEKINSEYFPIVFREMGVSDEEGLKTITADMKAVTPETFYFEMAIEFVDLLGDLGLTDEEAVDMIKGKFDNEENMNKVKALRKVLVSMKIELPGMLAYLFKEFQKGEITEGIRLEITASMAEHTVHMIQKALIE